MPDRYGIQSRLALLRFPPHFPGSHLMASMFEELEVYQKAVSLAAELPLFPAAGMRALGPITATTSRGRDFGTAE